MRASRTRLHNAREAARRTAGGTGESARRRLELGQMDRQQAELAAQGDDEAMRLDEDFLGEMEYALTPTGGMGMGIDRLLMALTGLGIRETILFPLLKPER